MLPVVDKCSLFSLTNFFSLQLQSQCSSCLAMTDDLTACQITTNSCSAVCFSYFFFLKSIFCLLLLNLMISHRKFSFSPKEEVFVMATEHSYNKLGFSLLRQEKKIRSRTDRVPAVLKL